MTTRMSSLASMSLDHAAWQVRRTYQRLLLERTSIEDDEWIRQQDTERTITTDIRKQGLDSPQLSPEPTLVGNDQPPASVSDTQQAADKRQADLGRTIPLHFLVEFLDRKRSAWRIAFDFFFFVPLLFLTLDTAVFRSASRSYDVSHFVHAVHTRITHQEVPPQGFHANDTRRSPEGPHHRMTFADIRSVAEWSLWLQRVVVPSFFDPLHPSTAPPYGGAPVGQSVPASPLRLRVVNVDRRSCRVEGFLVSSKSRHMFSMTEEDVPCYTSVDKAIGDSSVVIVLDPATGETIPRSASRCGGFNSVLMQVRGEVHNYDCDAGYTFDLHPGTTFSRALERTDLLLRSELLSDSATTLIVLDVLLYNSALDTFVLCEWITEILEGGAWVNTPRLSSFQTLATTESYTQGHRAADAVLMLIAVIFWGRFVSDWISSFRAHHRSAGAYFLEPWTIVNLMTLVCITVALVLTWAQADLGRRHSAVLRASVPYLYDDEVAAVASRPLVYPHVLVYLCRLEELRRWFAGIACILLFLKVIEFFRLNSRLNILTRTLRRVSEAAVGILVVFALFLAAFALSGHVLFGTDVFAYSSMTRSFTVSMQSLMGSFDYDRLKRSDSQLAFVYFWSLIVLGLFVLLNFMTAAIGNAFDSERQRIRLVPMLVALKRLRWHASAQGLRRQLHTYVRCVKAFHTVFPNSMWNRICEHVDTAIELDRVLWAQQGLAHAVGGSAVSSDASYIELLRQQHQEQRQEALMQSLVGLPFLLSAIGREDVAVLSEAYVADMFVEAVRAHDRRRPTGGTGRHWELLSSVESVLHEQLSNFLSSKWVARRLERKARRLAGTQRPPRTPDLGPLATIAEDLLASVPSTPRFGVGYDERRTADIVRRHAALMTPLADHYDKRQTPSLLRTAHRVGNLRVVAEHLLHLLHLEP